jgi:carotenoid cleavage dioxygenase
MKGNFAPVHEEITAFELEVEGAIPSELRGLYARNGANPRADQSSHWFRGDGMIHGVSLKNGRAEWYRNRWVRTPVFEGKPRTPDSMVDRHFSIANTNILGHAGRIMALVENAFPMELSRELETIGFHDYDGALKTSFTAHPKVCPATGEMHFFGYSVRPPFLTYHMADATGRLMRSLEIPVRGSTMVHDMALTTKHVIFMDLPVVFDVQQAQRGTMPFSWSDTYGARLAILKREAGLESLRWVEIDPCYVYHVANAFEMLDGTIIVDVAWYNEQWRGGPSNVSFESARLKRWTIAPDASKVREDFLDDRTIEFPRIDERRIGQPHNIVYTVATNGDLAGGDYHALIRYDLESGRTATHDFGARGLPSEFVMVAGQGGRGESDGWLMGFVYDRARNASDLVILDAQCMGARPIARIKLPARVPQGFHGNWIPDAQP